MWRKRPAPVRSPHPDGRVEQKLQHILALRALGEQQQKGVADTYEHVSEFRRKARSGDQIYSSQRMDQADRLARQIPAMEQRVSETFAEISRLTEGLSDTDLAYL